MAVQLATLKARPMASQLGCWLEPLTGQQLESLSVVQSDEP